MLLRPALFLGALAALGIQGGLVEPIQWGLVKKYFEALGLEQAENGPLCLLFSFLETFICKEFSGH